MTDETRRLLTNSSWEVDYSSKRNCLEIKSTDYHSGPLIISESEWRTFGESFRHDAEPVKNDYTQKIPPEDGPIKASMPVNEPQISSAFDHSSEEIGPRPKDLRVIDQQETWTIALSRDQKRVFIDCANSKGKALVLSRKELYGLGKMMGKRAWRKGGGTL